MLNIHIKRRIVMADNPNKKFSLGNLFANLGKSKEDVKKEADAAEAAKIRENAALQQAQAHAATQAVPATKVIAQHKVIEGQTLSHLALKYYGNTTEPYWRLIYEFNKAKIGPNHKNIYDGLVLDIPELPVSLKKL
jgi:nucleoid-associated protein YgaU